MKIKWKWRYLPIILILIFAMIVGVYLSSGYKAMPDVEAYKASTKEVTYSNEDWIEFSPAGIQPEVGIIFYPGGKVDPESYMPMMHRFAQNGYKSMIMPMPFNLAILSPNAAQKAMDAYPEIKHWYIGGHSLGGVMAATYAYKHLEQMDGLYLLASYPQEKYDLSSSSLPVLSICGTMDGFVSTDKIEASKKWLPEKTQFYWVEGGNHSQMGFYGFQEGDQEAQISREQQQEEVVTVILNWIAESLKSK